MNCESLLVFNIFQRIDCIQPFIDNLIFISTEKSILIYDCYEAIPRDQFTHSINNNQNEQQSCEILSSLSMKFIPAKQKYESLIQGKLIVQYKLKGFSILQIKKKKKHIQNNIFNSPNKTQYKIQFHQYHQFHFSSGFLKMCFDEQRYRQKNKNNKIKISNQQQDIAQLQLQIKRLQIQNQLILQYQSPMHIFTLIEENQMVEIIKLNINNLSIVERYQIDYENQQQNNSIVTIIKYFQQQISIKKEKQKFLIMAKDNGSLSLYKLPQQKHTHESPCNKKLCKQYLLQTYNLLDLNNYFGIKQSQLQRVQIIGVEILSHMLAIITLKKFGIYLIDLKCFKIIMKIQINRNINFSNTKILIKLKNQITEYQLCNLSNQIQNVNTNQIKKEVLLDNQLIISDESSIQFLKLKLKITKKINTNDVKLSQQRNINFNPQKNIQILNSSLCYVIDILNTKIINQIIYMSSIISQKQQNLIQSHNKLVGNNKKFIKLFGCSYHGKLFYFTV